MRKIMLLLLVVMSVLVLAEDAKPNLNLTEHEKFELRTLQTNVLSARLTVKDAEDNLRQARYDEMMQTKQFEDRVQRIFKDHNLKPEEYTVCGQPKPDSNCADSPKNDIMIKKTEKKEEKK